MTPAQKPGMVTTPQPSPPFPGAIRVVGEALRPAPQT
jgi:hypothetical protein